MSRSRSNLIDSIAMGRGRFEPMPRPRTALVCDKANSSAICDASRELARDQRGVYSTSQVTVSTRPKNSRYISARTKDAVRVRDQGRCSYADPQTGRRCESRYQIEFDHIKPHALGGTNDHQNLRIRCRSHNLLHATDQFDKKYMRQFVD